ncbi:hypothetical protein L2E82_50396 [Cichorium intybus]|nr:hypothetical protein L2E82_50396 [Cichorium intybus]
MAHPRTVVDGDDRRNVVVYEDDPLRFVAYVRDVIRIASQISNRSILFTVLGAVDSKAFITAVQGRGFTVNPPKRVADVDVCTVVCKAAGVICIIIFGGHGDEEEEGEEEEGEREGKRVEKIGHGISVVIQSTYETRKDGNNMVVFW